VESDIFLFREICIRLNMKLFSLDIAGNSTTLTTVQPPSGVTMTTPPLPNTNGVHNISGNIQMLSSSTGKQLFRKSTLINGLYSRIPIGNSSIWASQIWAHYVAMVMDAMQHYISICTCSSNVKTLCMTANDCHIVYDSVHWGICMHIIL
jgi:hypothetical protein